MAKVLSSGAAEVAPEYVDGECWYLALFGIYHPRKPDQIRGVFDSSAEFRNTSLSSILMSGPDMINSLLGLLLRFRKDRVAITADVENTETFSDSFGTKKTTKIRRSLNIG